MDISDLIPTTLVSLSINVVILAAGAGGATFFAKDLARRGKSAAGDANVIVSGDVDLLNMWEFEGISILSVAEFLAQL